MSKTIRNVDSRSTQDQGSIALITYSKQAGAQKNTEVGRRLIPIFDGTNYTCDATTRKAVGAGKNIAVYNNAGAVGSVTFGDATITSLAPGVTNASGKVGLACPPNDWSYFAGWTDTYVISSAATLLVYIIEDDTVLQLIP